MSFNTPFKVSLAALGVALALSPDAMARAIPATHISFDGGACTAKFVRSASGLIKETNRECTGDQNPWVEQDVVIQFRPLSGKPNPTCDPTGLVTTFVYTNTDPALEQIFVPGEQYNVCVYLEDAMVQEGTIDLTSAAGTTSVPITLPGSYEVCVRGTWSNRGGTDLLDAEYVSQDNWATYADGLPASDPMSAALGPNWGDVTINGEFVDWGAYNTAHRYCTTRTLAEGATLSLAVFDGQNGAVVPEWYADNTGSLSYTVTYVGP